MKTTENNGLAVTIISQPICYQTLQIPPKYLRKVSVSSSGCWIWQGSTGFHPDHRQHRYGQIRRPSKEGRVGSRTSAHRFFYECVNGPVPTGYDVDHICNVKLCVNPDHLQVLTHWENCKKRAGAR